MYKLFYALRSASMGVRVMLEEIGAPYELIQSTTDRSKPRPPQQIAVNPNGWVPVLTWNDGAMYECAAITVFLCDRHAEAGLAPAIDDPARALYLQTLVYFSSSVQNAFQLTYYPDRFADKPADEASAERRGERRLRKPGRWLTTRLVTANGYLETGLALQISICLCSPLGCDQIGCIQTSKSFQMSSALPMWFYSDRAANWSTNPGSQIQTTELLATSNKKKRQCRLLAHFLRCTDGSFRKQFRNLL